LKIRLIHILSIAICAAVLAGVVLSASSGVVQNEVPSQAVVGAISESNGLQEAPAAEVDWEPVLTALEIQDLGRSAGAHAHAFAQNLAILDRPRHPAVTSIVGEEHSVFGLRRRWHLRTSELAELNPGVDLARAEDGTELVVWQYDPERPARSQYRPNQGRLVNGELMPSGTGWVVRNERLAFAATQTIDGLVHALRVVQEEYPGGQGMMIADMSKITGGPFRPHRSHQSGRDVDLTYFENTTEPPEFSRTRPQELDAARTWAFLRTLITQHDITYVFISRPLQIRLYEHAESIGEHPAFLAEVFQYGPRRHRNNRGIIRFASGHHDHMHVRFDCTPEDIRCRGAR